VQHVIVVIGNALPNILPDPDFQPDVLTCQELNKILQFVWMEKKSKLLSKNNFQVEVSLCFKKCFQNNYSKYIFSASA